MADSGRPPWSPDDMARTIEIKAKFLVFAAGGLGNACLLLATQRSWPQKFGGPEGALGCFYTGHLTGYLATIRLHQQAVVPGLWYQEGARGSCMRRRLSISPDAQHSHSLLNTGFWLDPISIADPAHRSGALSAIYLGLETSGLYKRLGSGLAPSTIHGKSDGKRQHWANIRSDGKVIQGLLHVISCRLGQGKATRTRGLVNPAGHYLLRFHAEQSPDPDNRVRLLDDSHGSPLPDIRVDYRFAQRDAESVVRSHEVLDRWLRTHKLGLLEYLCPPQQRLEHVLGQAVDGYHQIGLTRMSANLRQGVVDPDCRVRDTDNLFVAGSSVFPTAGQANPTLAAIALSMRLGDHISRRLAEG